MATLTMDEMDALTPELRSLVHEYGEDAFVRAQHFAPEDKEDPEVMRKVLATERRRQQV